MTKRFTENHVSMFGNAFLQLFLQIATTVLILAQRGNLSLKIFQPSSSETVDCWTDEGTIE